MGKAETKTPPQKPAAQAPKPAPWSESFTAQEPWTYPQSDPIQDLERAIYAHKGMGMKPDGIWMSEDIIGLLRANDMLASNYEELFEETTTAFLGVNLHRESHPKFDERYVVVTSGDRSVVIMDVVQPLEELPWATPHQPDKRVILPSEQEVRSRHKTLRQQAVEAHQKMGSDPALVDRVGMPSQDVIDSFAASQ